MNYAQLTSTQWARHRQQLNAAGCSPIPHQIRTRAFFPSFFSHDEHVYLVWDLSESSSHAFSCSYAQHHDRKKREQGRELSFYFGYFLSVE